MTLCFIFCGFYYFKLFPLRAFIQTVFNEKRSYTHKSTLNPYEFIQLSSAGQLKIPPVKTEK